MNDAKESSANKWNSFSYVAISIVNFLVFTLAFKIFDPVLVGFYVLLNSIFFLGGNLDLGFGISTIKLIADANRKNDKQFIKEYFYTYFFAYLFLTIVVLTLQYFYFTFFIRGLISSNIEVQTANYIYALMCANFVFTFLYSYLRSFLEGLFYYVFIAKVLLFLNLILLITSFIIVLLFEDFLLFVGVSLIISATIFIFYLQKVYQNLGSFFKFRYLKFDLIKDNIKYSTKLQVSFFIGNSIDYLIKYLVTIFLSLGFVAIYESGKKFTTFINGFIYSNQKVLLVKLSDLNGKNKISESLVGDLFKYSNLSVRFVFLFYAVLNPGICVFLNYWFGNINTSIVFLLLALPQTFICFLISLYNVIIIEGKGMFLVIIQTLNVVLISGLTILWFVLFESYWGLIGYYLATILTTIIIFYYFRKFHDLSIIKFLKNAKFPKVILLNVMIFVEVILISKDLNFLIIMAVFQIVYLVLYYQETVSLILKFSQSILKIKK